VDAILTMLTDRIDEDALARAAGLRVISNYAVGVDNIDLKAATRRNIAVGHTPGVLTEATADLAFGLMIAAARRIVEGDRAVRRGGWKTWSPDFMLGRDIHGATLGIVGMGATGRAVARRGAGFGMKIVALGRHVGSPKGLVELSMAALLAQADFISVHLPLTPDTRGMFGRREFALMKPGAILINTARGAIVDQRALVTALRSGHLGGAALDVTDPEPINRADEILTMPNVIVTPHIGSASIEARSAMAELAVDNILDAIGGKLPRRCANKSIGLAPRAQGQPD
jgi:glyoxylate reductase